MRNKKAWENGEPRRELQHEIHEVERRANSKKTGKIVIGVLSSLFFLGAGVGIGYGIYTAELFGPVYNDTDSDNVETIANAEDASALFQKNTDGVIKDVTSDYLLKKDATKYTTDALFKVNADSEIDTTDVASNYILKATVDSDYLKKTDTSYGDKLFKATNNVLDNTTDQTSNYVLKVTVDNDYLKKTDTSYGNKLFKATNNVLDNITDETNNYILKTTVDSDYLKKTDTSYGDKLFKAAGGTLDVTNDVSSSYVVKPTDYANGNLYKVNSDTLSTTNVNASYFEKPTVSNIGDLYKVETNGQLSDDVKGNYVLVTNPDYANKLFKVGADGVLDVTTDVSSLYTENSTIAAPTVYADGLYKASNGAIDPTAVTSQYIEKTNNSYGDKLFKATSNVLDNVADVTDSYFKKPTTFAPGDLFRIQNDRSLSTNNVNSLYLNKPQSISPGDLFKVLPSGQLSAANVNAEYTLLTDTTNYGDKLFKATGGTLDVANDVTSSYVVKPTDYADGNLYKVDSDTLSTTNVNSSYIEKPATFNNGDYFVVNNGTLTPTTAPTTTTTPTNYADGLYEASGGSINPTAVTSQYITKPSVFNEDDLFKVENGVLTPTTPAAPTTRADGLYRVENGNITNLPVDGQYIRRYDPTNNPAGALYRVNGVGNVDRADVRNEYIKKTDASNADKLFKSTNGTISTTDVSNDYLLKTEVDRDYLKKTDPSYPAFALFGVNSAHTISTQNLADQYIRKTNLRLYTVGSLYEVDNTSTIITTNVRDQYLLRTTVESDYVKKTEISLRVDLERPSEIETKTYSNPNRTRNVTGKIAYAYLHNNIPRSIENFYIYETFGGSGKDSTTISNLGGHITLAKDKTSRQLYFVGENGGVYTIFQFNLTVTPTTDPTTNITTYSVTTAITESSIKHLWVQVNPKANPNDYSFGDILSLFTNQATTDYPTNGVSDQRLRNGVTLSGPGITIPLEAHQTVKV